MTVSGHNDEYNSVKPRISVISLTVACERSVIIENRLSRNFFRPLKPYAQSRFNQSPEPVQLSALRRPQNSLV